MKTPIYYTIINKGNIIENTIFKSLPTAVSDFDHLDVMRYLPAHVDISEICLLAESKDIPEFKNALDIILNKFETYTFNIVNDLIEITLTKDSLLNYQKNLLHQSNIINELLISKKNNNDLYTQELKSQLYGYEKSEYEPAFHIMNNDLIPNINEDKSEIAEPETAMLLSEGIYLLMNYFNENPEKTFTFYIVKDYTSYYEVE
ncbi:hypothetical protein INP28_01000 [Staphylococcus aureus]|nr:hypothetical protein [Staphylococcus aureus]MBO8786396.1 hypothetical protein [Staphylococcus aureus]